MREKLKEEAYLEKELIADVPHVLEHALDCHWSERRHEDAVYPLIWASFKDKVDRELTSHHVVLFMHITLH
jgi:hypothetical protein